MPTPARIAASAILLFLATSLVGCSPEPLTPADVHLTIKVEAPAETIVGDIAELSFDTTLPKDRNDSVETTLYVRAPEGDWESAESPVTLDLAGEWSFKTAVRIVEEDDDDRDDLTESAVETVQVADLQALTRDLFYNERIAYQEGSQVGWDYMVAHIYPGIWDASSAVAEAHRATMVEEGYWANSVPSPESLTPDSTWVIQDTSECAAPQEKPVDGRTFMLTTTYSYGYSQYGYQSVPAPAQVHVTLLEGKLYYYVSLC